MAPTTDQIRRSLAVVMLVGSSVLVASCASAPAPGERGTTPLPRYFTIPMATLEGAELAKPAFGPATMRRERAPDGRGVRFFFRGLRDEATIVKDDYPVDPRYGQAAASHGNGDFSHFGGFTLFMRNLDDRPVWVCICLNTGFTGASGRPPGDKMNDTFWMSPWYRLEGWNSTVLCLEFDSAVALNIEDNREPHTQGRNGSVTVINAHDRTEVSAVGFMIRSEDNSEAAILVRPAPATPRSAGSATLSTCGASCFACRISREGVRLSLRRRTRS